MTHTTRTPRRGFTIAEVLVALVLAAVGLLAVAGADSTAWRHRTHADRSLRGTLLARTRIESLASTDCAPTTGTLAHADGVVERWSAARAGPLLLTSASAVWPSPRGHDSLRLAGSRWCDR